MSILFTLLTSSPSINIPQSLLGGLIGGIGWLLLAGVIAGLLWRWRGYHKHWSMRSWGLFIFLLVIVPITSLFIGVRLPAAGALPPPDVPIDPQGPALMIFSALPWILAGGLLGPAPAAALAFFSGLLLAFWDTGNPFTPLELAFLAVLFSAVVNQRYRTPIYRLLRHPLAATLLTVLVYPLLFMLGAALIANAALVNRLDYGLTHVGIMTLALGGELLLAGLFTEVVAAALPSAWGNRGELLPSPAEKSLQSRFLYGVTPLAIVLILILMGGDWIVAGNAARQMLRERMANAAGLASDNVPFFLETGQSLIRKMAGNSDLKSRNSAELRQTLRQELRGVPFFNQLYVLDDRGNPLAGSPSDNYVSENMPPDVQVGVQRALNNVPFQYYVVSPQEGGTTAQVVFMSVITDTTQSVSGVLMGRADLASNPFTMPIIASLQSMSTIQGEGLLLDDSGRILYGPNPDLLMSTYLGQTVETPSFFDDTGPDGTRQLVYYQPALGRPWAVVLSVPAQRAQQLALNIAAPLLGIIVLLSLVALILLRLSLRGVTRSLENLAVQAGNIAQGQLDQTLNVDGEDEVGQLGRTFEKMRLSLKARLDELNRLLLVSQGVASSLEISQAVAPVLESALGTGACSARVVLAPTVVPDLEKDATTLTAFFHGPAGDLYRDLDEQILALTRQQDKLVLTSLTRPRILRPQSGSPRPEALLAVALRHENLYYGAMWIAFDQPHRFSDEETRFMATLAGQAALAAANARLFLNAEVGRQRLAAILASTPDPVLVTDQRNRLLLANPAAWRALGLGVEWDEGQPIEQVINQEALLTLLRSSSDEKQSVEVSLPDGRIYSATVSTVLAEGQRMGRVCVLQDVTNFKELDSLKSEFVSTVSHDLRSPLTLMRGYATMLDMVGELNEQQAGYVRKIVSGAENMSRLVTNLLDLGRIEAGVGLQLEMVSVRDVVDRVTGALQLTATQKRVHLMTEIPEHTNPLLEADPALLQQALHNLVENAIKYTDAGGRVQVRLESRQELMIFEVRDTGIGIAPVDQPHLFEKFYRGVQRQGEDKPTRGTGLGLAIVKSIAERHGGQVWVESQLGKGSTFFMAFPLHPPKSENANVKTEEARNF